MAWPVLGNCTIYVHAAAVRLKIMLHTSRLPCCTSNANISIPKLIFASQVQLQHHKVWLRSVHIWSGAKVGWIWINCTEDGCKHQERKRVEIEENRRAKASSTRTMLKCKEKNALGHLLSANLMLIKRNLLGKRKMLSSSIHILLNSGLRIQSVNRLKIDRIKLII